MTGIERMRTGLLAGILAGVPYLGAQPAPAPTPPTPPMLAQHTMELSSGARSFLGVGVAEIESARAKELKLKEEQGVEITSVEQDSPAAKAGLAKGDVVLQYNGQRVEGAEQFVRLVRETPAGRAAKLLISRNGATQTVAATIGTRKSALSMLRRPEGEWFVTPRIEIPPIRIPDIPRVYTTWRTSSLGVEAETLETQLATFFGVKEGVLVRSVIKGSAAEKAGFKAGDVIVKVDATSVTSPRDVSNAVRTARSKKTFPVTVTREKKEMTLTVTLDEGDRSEHDRTPAPRRVVVRSQEYEL